MKYIISLLEFKPLKRMLFLFAILFINSAVAKDFLIGVEEVSYYPLYDFSSSNENKASFTKEVLSTFFEHKNYRYKFVPLPIKRFDKWYIEQNIDFKFPDNFRWRHDKENKLNITFSESVVKLMAGTYVLKANENFYRDDVQKLGTIMGFSPTLWEDKLSNKDFKLVEESAPISLIKHLIYQNIDGVNIDPNVIEYNLKRLSANTEVVLNKNIHHEVFSYHLSSIKHPEIIKEFNDFLKENAELVSQMKIKYGIKEDFQ